MANTLNLGNGNWAVKKDSLLGYNSENGNYKPLPFDFTRASSATVVNKAGLIETVGSGEPRIDFKDNTKGALKLEPTRSNLYTYSNDVSFWSKSNVVTTSNYAISPDGTQNAFRAAFSSSTGLLYVTATGTIGTNNTLSVWAKSNNGSSNKFRFFANGTTTLSNDFITTDEWQRFEFTYNCTSVTSGLTGASDSATNDIIFYGFQHEVGSYATSYIPTSGQSGGVTRVADSSSQTNISNNIISSSYPFTIYVESENIYGAGVAISFIDTSAADKYFNVSIVNNVVTAYSRANSSLENIISGVTLTNGQRFKAAFTMENSTSGKLSVNGNIVSKTNFVNQSTNVNINDLLLGQLRVVSDNGERLPIYGARVYNTALTDAELQQLTS